MYREERRKWERLNLDGKTTIVGGSKWVYGQIYKVKSFFSDKEEQYYMRNEHLTDMSVIKETIRTIHTD